MMKIKCFTFAVFTLLALNETNASIRASLKKTFNALNFNSNITDASVFEDQASGHATLGSVHMRSAVKNTNIANIAMPSFGGGCNGIDLFLGAISFIKMNEYLNNLRSAIPAAAGYGFSIAMQSALPHVYNALSEMQDIIQKINAMNMNSCHLGALAVASVVSQSDASSSALCSAIKLGNDKVSDYNAAKHNCANSNTRRSTNLSKPDEYKDVLGEEFNLVWKAIRKNTFLSNNEITAEYFMSIAGTLLKAKDDKYASHKPSLAFDQNLIEMLLFGNDTNHRKKGKAKVYTCGADKENCISMIKKELIIDKEGSIAYQVEDVLNNLIEKLRSNQAPTEAEKGLINSTVIPVMDMLIVETAYRRGNAPISILNFKDEIAYDILINELNSILDLVYKSVSELEKVQIDGQTIHRFKQELKDVRSRLLKERQSILAHIDRAISAIDQTQQLKSKLHYKFNRYANLTR